MNIVIPMAGRGSRFANIGITTPKPLIDVRGSPMYVWATESLPLSLCTRLVFLCLREHLDNLGLRGDIMRRYGHRFDVRIVPVDQVTRGQAETVGLARHHLDGSDLLIYNADTAEHNHLDTLIPTLPASVRGLWTVFDAAGDKWSFARTMDGSLDTAVVETAEKKRISPWASTGLYWFRHAAEFLQLNDAAIARGSLSGGEYYVAPLYNDLIAAGAEVRAHRADAVWVLGTPEDLGHFQAHCPWVAPGQQASL
jgi:UDP-N-acetylglucosamine diphosphorylase / glucose-1-phosphate thymidylyltransferase / UDP-N-acetylgalactosamine diphosphorylase / glucosamine-1-phosphate N-acetyltransferase / galactosamine-1-phosphate N-acetyltransferase